MTKRFAFWAALAIAGHAASLQLIDAGTRLHYQHYFPPAGLAARPVSLAVVLLQFIFVIAAGRGACAVIWTWLRARLPLTVLALMFVALLGTSAAGTRPFSYYLYDLSVSVAVTAVSLVNIVLAILAMPDSKLTRFIERWFSVPEETTGRFDRAAIVLGLLVTLAAIVLNITAYQRHPHLRDEVTYTEQARFIAHGVLQAPAPPVPEAFQHYLMDFQPDRWFPVTPPGWPAVLAVGMFFGVPWLVNPVLGGLNIVLASWLLNALFTRREARMGIFLLAISPWHLFLAMSFMTHMSQLATALFAAIGIVECRRTGKWSWAFAAGLAAGWTALNRPLDGTVLCAMLGLWAIGLGGKRIPFPSLVAFALGTAITGSFILQFNNALTGSPLKFPINEYNDRHYGPNFNKYGFGPDRGADWGLDPFPGHGPVDGMINMNLNGHSLNTELFGWPVGATLLLALALFRKRPAGNDLRMLAMMAAICTTYFFYWYSGGPDFGARYWFLILIPCIGLTLSALGWLADQAGDQAWRVRCGVVLACVCTLVNYVPWRATDKYYHYLDMRPDLLKLTGGSPNALVLIQGVEFPDYVSGANYNQPDVRRPGAVYAWDTTQEVRLKLLAAFPDRTVWLVKGPTMTGAGYEVERGPVPASQLLAESK